jgi:acyl phosphate:glycerol-3-phosphate acyltransferase
MFYEITGFINESFTDIAVLFFSLVPYYFIGAFPTGVIVSRYYNVDITKKGSGNVGATNIARVVGKKAGVLTLFGDLLKGFLSLCIACCSWKLFDAIFGVMSSPTRHFEAAAPQELLYQELYILLVGFVTVAGHCFSIAGILKGGKGVATSLGVLLFIDFKAAFACIGVFIFVMAISRIVSLSSILAAISLPFLFAFFYEGSRFKIYYIIFSSLLCLLVVYKHRENIVRLLKGEEKQFTSKRA